MTTPAIARSLARPAISLFITVASLNAQPVPKTAPPAVLTSAMAEGSWLATLEHDGETRPFGLTFHAVDDRTLKVTMTNPALHIHDLPIGEATIESGALHLGAEFVLTYDSSADTFTMVLPEGQVPLYKMKAVFHRGRAEVEAARGLDGPTVAPVWSFDAGAPIWADVAYDHGVAYVGADDGRLHALDGKSGHEKWVFRAGAAIRARATVDGATVLVQADDGFLYRLDAATGSLLWKARVDEKPIERLPPSNPKSRFNRFASAVTAGPDALYLGTDDGHVLALDRAAGSRRWDFTAGDSVLSTPALADGCLYFGSFDHNVYAVDAATGRLIWKHDTGAPVVSTPAIHQGIAIVGSRSYDLVALDAATGRPVWTRYIWFSWIESPAVVRNDTAYVGSSDAARLFALDARTGRTRWDLDVMGWAWGQPAVTETRIFIGTAGVANYPVKHLPGVLGVDRQTGRVAWRYQADATAIGTFGFPASPAVGDGLVVIGGVDGRVYAFAQ